MWINTHTEWIKGKSVTKVLIGAAEGGVLVETKKIYYWLTVKVKHAAMLATDSPFLVNCNGPSFIIKYE